jgi:hypothetical protein
MKKGSISAKFLTALAVVVALAALVAGCTAGGSGGSGGTPVVMSGVMLKGSVILNGVHFDVPAGAAISVDGSSATDASLKDGMVVTLRGTIDGNGTGTLEKLESSDELQGPIEAVNAVAGTLTVLSQTIYVDDQTRYGNLPGGLGDLGVDDMVEVHGMRDSLDNIRATRIELLTGSPETELKGIISSVTATTFAVGAFVVDYSAATIKPTGTTLTDGMRVEARLSGTSATQVEVKDLTKDPDLEPVEGSRVEVRGLVTGFAGHPGTFVVNGQSVETTASTEFSHGSSASLANDVSIEVEGSVNAGGVLVADEVKFTRVRVKIEGDVTSRTDATITLLGLTVNKTPFTEGSWPAGAGRYAVKGYVDDTGTTLYAEEIETASPGDDDVLQAPVQAEVGNPTWTMTLLGLVIDLSGATFGGDDVGALTRDQFFAAVGPGTGAGGTLIKVKLEPATLTANEAELDD